MKTLIELYDERPVENVLAGEIFKPETIVFLCPSEAAQDKAMQRKMREFYAHRGVKTELVFLESSIYNAQKIKKQLRTVTETYPDCVLDITGGTDAALFAGGALCAETGIPAFTYSRSKNMFFDIHNAPMAEDLKCETEYSVEDCFLMAGGALRTGRVDNSILAGYMDVIDPFFDLYMKYRRDWVDIVGYIQRVSYVPKDEPIYLDVTGNYEVKSERGGRISANEPALVDIKDLGFISGLKVSRTEGVSFRFRDETVRTFLRDVGMALELYVYKAFLDSGLFSDVVTSAVVDWDSDHMREGVTNEIDVMATRGIVPVFVSCKTGDISTEAINELAVLRDRFGGNIAKAAIVTAERCRAITRHRASDLDIKIIDYDDLSSGPLGHHIEMLMK